MGDNISTSIIGSAYNRPDDKGPPRASYFRSVAAYWEELYEDKHLTARIYQERKDVTLEWAQDFQLPRSARVLDLGCGAGHTAVALAQLGYEVQAIDCEQTMLDMVARRAEAAGVSLSLSIGDAHELQAEDRSFDLVVALGLIPWLHSPEKALSEMRRVLKPGGFLVISSDNRRRLTYWFDPIYNLALAPCRNVIKSALRRRGWMKMPHTAPLLMHSMREFDRCLEHAGFSKLTATTIGFGPFTFFRFNLLPDRLGTKLHDLLQRFAYCQVPVFRQSGAHYVVAA